MNENRQLIEAQIKEIESRIEVNKAHAELLRAQTKTQLNIADQGRAREPAKDE